MSNKKSENDGNTSEDDTVSREESRQKASIRKGSPPPQVQRPSEAPPFQDTTQATNSTVVGSSSTPQRHSSRTGNLTEPSEVFGSLAAIGGRRHKKGETLSKRGEVSVTVETPDGQRLVVRVRPEQTIRYLLDVCCRRLKVNPNDHYFVHDYRELVEGTRMAQSGITTNDVIKLFKGKKTILHRKIRVIIKVRDVRIGSIFRDTDNLWHIIKILLAKEYIEADLVPIVLYNKEEFIGVELLSRVRLRDIGVTSGTCTLKFIQLKKEDLDLRGLKTDEDENAMTTLESLELLAAGPTQDTGLRAVSFKTEDDVPSLQFIGERKALAFKQPDAGGEEIEEILREEFFDLTVEEIAYFYKEIRQKHTDFDNMNPRTALLLARKEMEELRRRKTVCEETIIRVQLPDKMVLQGVFTPDETINDVKSFVKKYVKEMDLDWDLYHHDPSDVLSGESTLKEVNCVPCAKLFMGCPVRMASVDHILQEDINLVPIASADEAALIYRGDSLEQFFGSFDRDSYEVNKSGFGYASLKYRSNKRTSGLSFLRKSSGGLRRFRKSFGKSSLASKASVSSDVSTFQRGRRSMPVDPSHLPGMPRSSLRLNEDLDVDDADDQHRDTLIDDEGRESEIMLRRRTTVQGERDSAEYFRDSLDDTKDSSKSPSNSDIDLNRPSTSKSNYPNSEKR